MSNSTTTSLTTVTLDIAHDESDLALVLMNMVEELDTITYRIVARYGRANGWPEVRFQGDMSEIVAMLMAYCNGDAAQAYELLMA